MADYIDNSCHIDDTTDVIDEVDILSTYTAIQEHQSDEIIISSSIVVSARVASISIAFISLSLLTMCCVVAIYIVRYVDIYFVRVCNCLRSREQFRHTNMLDSHRAHTQHLEK